MIKIPNFFPLGLDVSPWHSTSGSLPPKFAGPWSHCVGPKYPSGATGAYGQRPHEQQLVLCMALKGSSLPFGNSIWSNIIAKSNHWAKSRIYMGFLCKHNDQLLALPCCLKMSCHHSIWWFQILQNLGGSSYGFKTTSQDIPGYSKFFPTRPEFSSCFSHAASRNVTWT